MKQIVALLTIALFLLPLTTSAQDFCEGNFDYDDDQDGSDAFTFKTDFGRSSFGNPCPPDGPAPVLQTGQTISYSTGDDGDLVKGVAWPNPRFGDNADGTVTDNLTGLMWLQDANCIETLYPEFDNDGTIGDGRVTWQHALDFVEGINNGTFQNCAADYSDWRLPNLFELESLRDIAYYSPCLSNAAGTAQWTDGDAFFNVVANFWTSSTSPTSANTALLVSIATCGIGFGTKETLYYQIWPVRGGH